MKIFKKFYIIALVLCANIGLAQVKQYILILSKSEKKLVVLDYETLDSITKIAVGEDPHEIITSPDGSTAYVSKPMMNASGHTIEVINLKTLQPEKQIDTKPFFIPHGLAYVNDKLWFTAQGSKSVAIYNPLEGKIEQALGTGEDFTHLIYVKPDGNSFYTTNVESGTVSIYEKKELPPYMPPTGVLPPNAKPRTEWRQKLVNVGKGCEGFDIASEGKELWTALPDGNIVIVDLENKKIRAKINTNVQGLHRLKITPDGKTACIVSVKTGELLFYNVQKHNLEKKIKIGQGAGIFMDLGKNRMFISCTPNNYVSVIDLKTRKEITRLEIGKPDGITSVKVE